MSQKEVSVLFVCLGNICRSPAAHGVMEKTISEHAAELKAKGITVRVDSCGTCNHHIGQSPDSRMRSCARKRGITLDHRARQFETSDFDEFDYILTMDKYNKSDVLSLSKDQKKKSKVSLFTDFCIKNKDADEVPDPYFGGNSGMRLLFFFILFSFI
jgi:protein-tyrosine phosphatase